LQDLGFLAFTLPQVEILMPTKKPRGQELPLEEKLANQALHYRRLRIEHVNSSVKRCRIVKDRIRLYLLSASLTIPLIHCHIKSFRRASSCSEAMARRRKEERRAGIASRGM
jgi:hypothetical protein